jgi:hypothetical protein
MEQTVDTFELRPSIQTTRNNVSLTLVRASANGMLVRSTGDALYHPATEFDLTDEQKKLIAKQVERRRQEISETQRFPQRRQQQRAY